MAWVMKMAVANYAPLEPVSRTSDSTYADPFSRDYLKSQIARSALDELEASIEWDMLDVHPEYDFEDDEPDEGLECTDEEPEDWDTEYIRSMLEAE
jgi:hypothetical protein